MTTKLQDLRAKLTAQNTKSPTDQTFFPFWKLANNQSVSIRFVPDADTSNTFFWATRVTMDLPFEGFVLTVPCLEMYGEKCPLKAEVSKAWHDNEEVARKAWPKKRYIFGGFIHGANPLEQEEEPRLLKRFMFGPQIYKIIEASIMDAEMEEIPTDYAKGRDFKLVKSQKGTFADYSTSKWSMKERELSKEEKTDIEFKGLYNLKDFIPARPSQQQIDLGLEAVKAYLDGQDYDARFNAAGNYKQVNRSFG